MNALRLIAGKTARRRIEDNGLTPELVRMVLGASGGPKWLVLLGLDKLIFGSWLKGCSHTIDLVGSSIGAWRMTTASHPDVEATLEKFIGLYLQMRREHANDSQTLTAVSYQMLDELYDEADLNLILENSGRNLNIVTVHSKNMKKSASNLQEGARIFASYSANALKRKYLAKFYDRVVFYSGEGVPCEEAWTDFNRTDVKLTPDTLKDALMASGSIPFVAEPIVDITGAPEGVYRDGGIIDYHFALPWRVKEGIILYPHFSQHIIPGWFDKKRKTRRAGSDIWDQLLMLTPSDEFVAALPGGKIPDRTDFTSMTDDDRLAYWRIVITESERLSDEFSMCLEDQTLLMERLEHGPV